MVRICPIWAWKIYNINMEYLSKLVVQFSYFVHTCSWQDFDDFTQTKNNLLSDSNCWPFSFICILSLSSLTSISHMSTNRQIVSTLFVNTCRVCIVAKFSKSIRLQQYPSILCLVCNLKCMPNKRKKIEFSPYFRLNEANHKRFMYFKMSPIQVRAVWFCLVKQAISAFFSFYFLLEMHVKVVCFKQWRSKLLC